MEQKLTIVKGEPAQYAFLGAENGNLLPAYTIKAALISYGHQVLATITESAGIVRTMNSATGPGFTLSFDAAQTKKVTDGASLALVLQKAGHAPLQLEIPLTIVQPLIP